MELIMLSSCLSINSIQSLSLKFFDVTFPKLPESKACAEIGGLMENNSFWWINGKQ
jgi:hypothetical protein